MRWWLSGLPAIAANLLLDAGPDPQAHLVQRLAARLLHFEHPLGWLIWPDQQPHRQRAVLTDVGFRLSERLWLGGLSIPLALTPLEAVQSNPWSGSVAGVPASRLLPVDRQRYGAFLMACHQIPRRLAELVAQAFVTAPHQHSGTPLLAAAGATQLATFAFADPIGRLQASITACCASVERQGTEPMPVGGLVWLGTHPAARRQGLARQLTEQACLWLQAQGVQEIVVQASQPAVPLYRALGFQPQGSLELWSPAGLGDRR